MEQAKSEFNEIEKNKIFNLFDVGRLGLAESIEGQGFGNFKIGHFYSGSGAGKKYTIDLDIEISAKIPYCNSCSQLELKSYHPTAWSLWIPAIGFVICFIYLGYFFSPLDNSNSFFNNIGSHLERIIIGGLLGFVSALIIWAMIGILFQKLFPNIRNRKKEEDKRNLSDIEYKIKWNPIPFAVSKIGDKGGVINLGRVSINQISEVNILSGRANFYAQYEFVDSDYAKKFVSLNPGSRMVKQPKRSLNRAAENALIQAATDGDITLVKKSLQQGEDINTKDTEGKTALMYAAQKINYDIVKYLIKKGADINAKAKDGSTAIFYSNKRNIKFLAENGANIHEKNADGETALIYAAKMGFGDRVETLVEKGADINEKAHDGATALYKAVENSLSNTVKILLEKGADTEIQTNSGKTPLSLAIEKGHDRMVNMFKQLKNKNE